MLIPMNIKDIRRRKLRSYRDAVTKTDTALADLLEMGLSQLNQIIGDNFTRNIGDRLAAKIEQKLEKPVGWLDNLEDPKPLNANQSLRPYITDMDEFQRQLNYFYEGMSLAHKETIVMLANKLYGIDQPQDKRATPFTSPLDKIQGHDLEHRSFVSNGDEDGESESHIYRGKKKQDYR
jgi:hypothetical protein